MFTIIYKKYFLEKNEEDIKKNLYIYKGKIQKFL